jgi:hypothetical protein
MISSQIKHHGDTYLTTVVVEPFWFEEISMGVTNKLIIIYCHSHNN